MNPSPLPVEPTLCTRRRHAKLALVFVLALVSSVTYAITSSGADEPLAKDVYSSLWAGDSPVRVKSHKSGRAIELGTRFSADRHGRVHGVRFWKTKTNTGRHVASLWGPKGGLLARSTFKDETARGWQEVTFKSSVKIRAGKQYVVSYHSPTGRYAATAHYADSSASNVLSLSGKNSGVVHHGGAKFPHRVAKERQFWVDVLFAPRKTATGSPSPSPSTTPSTSPSDLCAPQPSACGYPDATNTGPAAGTAMTQVPAQLASGPGWQWNSTYNTVFVSGAGAVLQGLDIAGGVVIDAPGVVVKNNRISSCGGSDDSDVVAVRYRPSSEYNGSGAQIVHNDINGTPAGCSHRARSGVRDVFGEAPNVLVDGNDISGTGNGITIEHEGLIANNWIHNLGHIAGDHHSGISNHGGSVGVTIRHNTVLLHDMPSPGGGGVSGALTVYADFAHAQNVTLEDNLISGGSYVIYGGNSGDDYSTPSTNIKIVSNRFVCGDWLYGPLTAFNAKSSGNQWSGNYCDGLGTPVQQ